MNKLNPLRAGCHFEVPREITLKKAVVSVKSMDNACFAWSVVAALYPAKSHVDRKSSYPHCTAVLNLTNIEFPMILKDIPKFERLNAVSINVYGIENKQILPLRLTGDKKEKHVNLLYLQDPRDNGDCQKLNDCAIRLPSEDDRWLEFSNHRNQERVPFIVYADLECILRKTEPDKEDASSYTYQQHEVCSIELNTNFRTHAKNDFEKNLYKLMNNAVFGKTMENVRNHVDVKLLTKWDGRYGAEAMIAKPNFYSRSVFAENLIAVELRKLEVKFNKPIYVGMCILDISKVCLYEFHYDYMLPLFRDKCKIMYTDTDSLIYHVECKDIYETMKRDIARFDTSDYPADNAYGMSLANKKVPGLMKDENNDMIMTEFVGLRAKMYALKVDGKKDTKKAKGVKNNVVARDDYTRCLNDEIEMTLRQSCIRSKLHEVYTISETKIALSPYDDKLYIVPNTTETLPWGHWRIPL
ncbi:hypothetical protein ALC57_04933 [Trachymyrmex cornetzi]|uniref:DNA-directed DNA polymerase n=1 Tax=Trachymyrmex cornetzi TaxID=471704 RepID=A0A151JC11_9HYME|nr:hypothetical protein ALC57_04933 [Trachymyrmex cornetzi]